MKIWKYSKYDSIMFFLSIMQLTIMLSTAYYWDQWSNIERLSGFAAVLFLMTYSVIVISHLFTHKQWFGLEILNKACSMLNSINIGQSVQAYQLSHVRNHHKYNNDQLDSEGKAKDTSSTFVGGKAGEHNSVIRYSFVRATWSMIDAIKELFTIRSFWRVTADEDEILDLTSNSEEIKKNELRQVQLDRAALFIFVCVSSIISWQWILVCFVPAYFLALTLVNVQNYYEHYGANPEARGANSVSHYGKLYNAITFNDGYHQEHHLRPGAHWRGLPKVRCHCADELKKQPRIISPFPAILGFLDSQRDLLHPKNSPVPPKGHSVANKDEGNG